MYTVRNILRMSSLTFVLLAVITPNAFAQPPGNAIKLSHGAGGVAIEPGPPIP
jgi:hypothetical protein